MTPKIHVRRINSLLYRSGLKKAESPKHKNRIFDARVSTDLKSEHLSFNEVKGVENPSRIKATNKLSDLRAKFLTNEGATKLSNQQIHYYIKNKVAGLRENYHPNNTENSDTQRFVLSFSRRLKYLDKQIKAHPFLEKAVEIEHETLEFIYNHLFSQVFHIKPKEYSKNPIVLFQTMQKLIEKSLEKMLEEVDDLSLEFKSHSFLFHLGEEVKVLMSEIESVGGELSHALNHFLPYYAHEGVKELSVY